MQDLRSPQHVVILGAGAMGCLFGGLLKAGGLNVTLADVCLEHVEAINRNGLRLVGYGGDRTIRVDATATMKGLPPADIVSVHCKAFDTAHAIRSALPVFGEHTVAISFQNGIGNEEILAQVVGSDRVLGGWTAQGASVEAPGVVRNYGALPSHIGEMTGGISDRVRAIAAAFDKPGLPTEAADDIVRGMWTKMMANIALSAPSAFANLRVGEVAAVPELRAVINVALDEAAAVAEAAGVELDAADAHRVLDQILGKEGTGANKSTLCVDILNERPTEIDFINGVVVRLGRQFGVPTPVNATFVAAVKGLESRYLKRDGPT